MTHNQCVAEFNNAMDFLFSHWTYGVLILGIFIGLFLFPWLHMLFQYLLSKLTNSKSEAF